MTRSLKSARLYAILDTGYVPRERWLTTCKALISGGADIIQLRMKKQDASERRNLLELVLPLFSQPSAPPLIINDDLELALSHPRLGLHIGQDDTPPEIARKQLGAGRILGLSTHSIEQARAALALPTGTIDYFAVGPVFPTQTKPDYKPVGLSLVSQVAALEPQLPHFCIGGINRKTLSEALSAGAPRVVVVSDILCAPDPAQITREIRAAVPEPKSS